MRREVCAEAWCIKGKREDMELDPPCTGKPSPGRVREGMSGAS